MSTSKTIFIIGLPGVGKTFLGKQLSETCKIPFIDSDDAILNSYNFNNQTESSIAKIFQNHGELYFRELERNFIKKLSPISQVISCGGGLPCYFDNIEQLKQLGTVVWLKTDLETNAKNIISSMEERALFKDKNKAVVYNILQELLQQRAYFYQKAHYTISSQNGNALKETTKIVTQLNLKF